MCAHHDMILLLCLVVLLTIHPTDCDVIYNVFSYSDLCSVWTQVQQRQKQSNNNESIGRLTIVVKDKASSNDVLPPCCDIVPQVSYNLTFECEPFLLQSQTYLRCNDTTGDSRVMSLVLTSPWIGVNVSGCSFQGSVQIIGTPTTTLMVQNTTFQGQTTPLHSSCWEDDLMDHMPDPALTYPVGLEVLNVQNVTLLNILAARYPNGAIQVTSQSFQAVNISIQECCGSGGLFVSNTDTVLVQSLSCIRCAWTFRTEVSAAGALTLRDVGRAQILDVTSRQTRSIAGSASIFAQVTTNVLVDGVDLSQCISLGMGIGGCLGLHWTNITTVRNVRIEDSTSLASGGCVSFLVSRIIDARNFWLSRCSTARIGGALYVSESSTASHTMYMKNITLQYSSTSSANGGIFFLQGGTPNPPLVKLRLRDVFVYNSSARKQELKNVVADYETHNEWFGKPPIIVFTEQNITRRVTATKTISQSVVYANISNRSNSTNVIGNTTTHHVDVAHRSGSAATTALNTALFAQTVSAVVASASHGWTASTVVSMFDSTCSDNMLQGVAKESSWGLSPLHFLAGSMHPTLTDGTSGVLWNSILFFGILIPHGVMTYLAVRAKASVVHESQSEAAVARGQVLDTLLFPSIPISIGALFFQGTVHYAVVHLTWIDPTGSQSKNMSMGVGILVVVLGLVVPFLCLWVYPLVWLRRNREHRYEVTPPRPYAILNWVLPSGVWLPEPKSHAVCLGDALPSFRYGYVVDLTLLMYVGVLTGLRPKDQSGCDGVACCIIAGLLLYVVYVMRYRCSRSPAVCVTRSLCMISNAVLCGLAVFARDNIPMNVLELFTVIASIFNMMDATVCISSCCSDVVVYKTHFDDVSSPSSIVGVHVEMHNKNDNPDGGYSSTTVAFLPTQSQKELLL